jgi:glycosyltransferase involved in cell wall biosynthesis
MNKIVYAARFAAVFPSRAANTIHAVRMCEALAQLGHDVTLIVSANGYSNESIAEYYGIEKPFEIVQIDVPRLKGKSVLYACRAASAIVRIGPDVAITRDVHVCAFAVIRGTKAIYDAHGPIWKTGIAENLSFEVASRSRNLVKMTVNSNALRALFVAHGKVPAVGIEVAHNGARAHDLTQCIDGWPGRIEALQIGYFGHLYSGRGIELILKCAEHLPQMDFHIVGGTEDDLGYWASKSRAFNVHFHGFVLPSQVSKYRNMVDVLLAPYSQSGVSMHGGSGDQSDYMNPIKIIEYMSSRKVVLASNISAVREVLEHMQTAYLCNPADVGDWVSALKVLEGDADLRNELAANAYEKFRASLTWEHRAKKLIHV